MKKLIYLVLLFTTALSAQIKLKKTSIDIVEKLVELNPENFNPDFSKYDQLTSLYCAQLSDLVYWDDEHIRWLKENLNRIYPSNKIEITPLKVENLSAEALLWRTNDFLVVVLRGTEFTVIGDWITDGKFWKYANDSSSGKDLQGLLPGHGGFRRSMIEFIQKKNIYGEIDKIVRNNPKNSDPKTIPIYLTGHSLGAGISQLFINALVENGYNFSGAYHFAPPLSVDCNRNDELVSKYKSKVYDIINGKDYVPRAGRNGVQHFGQFFRIGGESGLIYSEKEAYLKFNFLEGRIRKEVKYHRIQNHIKQIRRSENDYNSIKARSTDDYHEYKPKEELDFCPGKSAKK